MIRLSRLSQSVVFGGNIGKIGEYMSWQEFFRGKKVTVMGLGLLGRGLNDAKFLAKYCGEVLVTDLKSADELASSVAEIKDLPNVRLVLGEHRMDDFENSDFVLKAAGVPIDSPFMARAKAAGVPVYMDEALFTKLSPNVVTVGVTGTRGKSTVTQMIYEILRADERRVFLGGNVKGLATLPLLEEARDGDTVVMELSSWQLQGFGQLQMSPHIAVFTNFSEDHMNYYKGDMRKYFADKKYIYEFQKDGDVLFYGEGLLESDFPAEARQIRAADLPQDLTLRLPAEHDRTNAAMAWAVCEKLGVSEEVIKKTLENFRNLPGRQELVRQIGEVAFYNDTNSTSALSVINALKTFSAEGKKIALILGGADKAGKTDELVREVNEKAGAVFLLPGSGTDKIKDKINGGVEVASMEEAVRLAHVSVRDTGGVVLLSPGFASFGMFKNEYDRGDRFNEAVRKL